MARTNLKWRLVYQQLLVVHLMWEENAQHKVTNGMTFVVVVLAFVIVELAFVAVVVSSSGTSMRRECFVERMQCF